MLISLWITANVIMIDAITAIMHGLRHVVAEVNADRLARPVQEPVVVLFCYMLVVDYYC